MVEPALHWIATIRFLRSAVTSFPGMCAIARQTMKRVVVVCLALASGVALSLDFISTHHLAVAQRAVFSEARAPRVLNPCAPELILDAGPRDLMAS
jgi:hypothetical protein